MDNIYISRIRKLLGDNMSYEVIRTVRQLIESGIGDSARLVHILDRLEGGKYLYLSDQKYLENLLSSSEKILSKPATSEPQEFENLETELKDINVRLEKILQNKTSSEKNITDNAQAGNIGSSAKPSTIINEILRPKSKEITLTLSVVLGLISLQGIGHIYLKKTAKGFGILVTSLIMSSLLFSYFSGFIKNVIPSFPDAFIPIMIGGYFGLYAFQILDSRKLCTNYNAYISEHMKLPPWW